MGTGSAFKFEKLQSMFEKQRNSLGRKSFGKTNESRGKAQEKLRKSKGKAKEGPRKSRGKSMETPRKITKKRRNDTGRT